MTSGGLAAVSSSAFAALYSAFGKYDVVHIHAEGPAFFAWLPKMFGKRVVVCSAFGRYDVVHIHAEGPAFFCWIPKLFGKRVISTIHGLDWAREKWKFGVGSKFIRQGEKMP